MMSTKHSYQDDFEDELNHMERHDWKYAQIGTINRSVFNKLFFGVVTEDQIRGELANITKRNVEHVHIVTLKNDDVVVMIVLH
jgi:hypothetical protein